MQHTCMYPSLQALHDSPPACSDPALLWSLDASLIWWVPHLCTKLWLEQEGRLCGPSWSRCLLENLPKAPDIKIIVKINTISRSENIICKLSLLFLAIIQEKGLWTPSQKPANLCFPFTAPVQCWFEVPCTSIRMPECLVWLFICFLFVCLFQHCLGEEEAWPNQSDTAKATIYSVHYSRTYNFARGFTGFVRMVVILFNPIRPYC